MKQKVKQISSILFSVFLVWIVGYGLFLGSILMARPAAPDQTTDAIVVLTGGLGRIETGLALFAAGKASHLFISGVDKTTTMDHILDRWDNSVALPPCCITLGDKATTTVENAQEVREWLENKDYTSIRLVTSDFHIDRSMIEMQHVMPDIEIIPHPIVQPNVTPKDLWFWVVSFKEYHKTLYRWACMILSPPPSMPHMGA